MQYVARKKPAEQVPEVNLLQQASKDVDERSQKLLSDDFVDNLLASFVSSLDEAFDE